MELQKVYEKRNIIKPNTINQWSINCYFASKKNDTYCSIDCHTEYKKFIKVYAQQCDYNSALSHQLNNNSTNGVAETDLDEGSFYDYDS